MIVMWLVLAFCLLVLLATVYLGLPLALESLADYREGWLSLGLFVFLFLFLGAGPIVLVLALLVGAWLYRKSTLSDSRREA